MLKTRIILVIASAVVIWAIFLLPKAVVENESQLKGNDSTSSPKGTAQTKGHSEIPPEVVASIKEIKLAYSSSASNEKNAIFADSLQSLYSAAGQFDSAAMYGAEAAAFFNTTESFLRVGNSYYEASTFAMDPGKQKALASKAREWLGKVVDADPKNYEARVKVAMTYLSSGNPMRGIQALRDVLKEDPKNELALFNMGILSIQSGQNSKAIDWLTQLGAVNPHHVQGQLWLGVAYMNDGKKKEARLQFEKVKQMNSDPAVLATVNSYLKDLK